MSVEAATEICSKSPVKDMDTESKTPETEEAAPPTEVKGEVDNGQTQADVKESEKLNPYAYTETGAFTSEIFKIELQNLPKYFGVKQMKKKLNALKLDPVKIKVMEKSCYAYINFKNEEDREKALTLLDGQQWKNKTIKAKRAKAVADPLIQKRKLEAELADDDSKKSKVEDNRSVEERLNDSVTPYWNLPYDEQLQKKQEAMRTYFKDLARLICRENKFQIPFVEEQRKVNDGFCCKLCTIKQSPVVKNYRNKCEFTIGQSLEKKDKTIGFRLGSYKSGAVGVVHPTECHHVPEHIKPVLSEIERFCQDKSELPGLDPETKAGNWHMVTMRTTSNGDVMAVLHLNTQAIEKPEEAIEKEKKSMCEYFSDHVGEGKAMTSLHLETQTADKKDGTVMTHLLGATHIHETLLNLKFRISPSAFFQVNTAAAEVLYSTVGELANITKDTIVLDVCCGTGTIGLTLAKKAKLVVGIEMCKEAIEDAKVNAKLNDIENAQFYCSKAEDILPKLIGRYQKEQVVAIVDPPRAGLHPDVVRAIRKSEFVKRLVYVSCQPSAAKPNIVDLTREESRRIQGDEFKLHEAIPVDLFPLTPHCELVMLFQR